MMRNRIAAGIATLALAAVASVLAAGLRIVPTLDVRDSGGRLLASLALPDGRFDLVFRHSIHRTLVEERYRAEPGPGSATSLRLYELRYESPGNGMPSEVEGEYRLEDGRFVMSMNRVFSKIPLIVSIVPGHGVAVAGVFHPFAEWAEPEDALALEARRVLRFIPRR